MLLVEDTSEDVRHFTAIITEDAQVAVAETGAEAVDRLFRRGRFHNDCFRSFN